MKVHSVQYHRIIIDVNILVIVVRSCRRRLGLVLWNVYFVVEGEWHFHQIRQQLTVCTLEKLIVFFTA